MRTKSKKPPINFALLREHVRSTGKGPAAISKEIELPAGHGAHASVLSKFLYGEDRLSLEHFALLVIWLDKSADTYILRPLRAVSDPEPGAST